MSNARNLARLIVDGNGDVGTASLDNVPPSNDASALTTGTLPIARIADGAVTAGKLASGAAATNLGTGNVTASMLASTLDLTGKTVTLPSGTGGKVLQVVQNKYTTGIAVSGRNSSSWYEVFQCSITPSSSSSKIMVQVFLTGSMANAGSFHCQITRNGSPIAIGTDGNSIPKETMDGLDNNATHTDGSLAATAIWMDSPSTTSPTTYAVRCHGGDGGTFYINRTIQNSNTTHDKNTVSTITLWEIAA